MKFLYSNGRKFVHALGQAYILDRYRRDERPRQSPIFSRWLPFRTI